MKATSANFLNVIKGPKQFVIPIYQRTYSWQIAQCSKLFDDILRISKDPSIPGHFIGSVVYFQESIHTVSDVPKLLVIDGQQRLTTISLMIAALAEFIRDNTVDIDTTATKLRNYYLLNSEETNELQYKLLLTRRDKSSLISIINGTPLATDHSLRVAENFKYFRDRINSNNAVDIYNGILRLFIVDVALEKEKDNPQLIFESLNSTGLDLSQADLIRNYILMGQEITLQTELYEKFWFPMEQSYGNDYNVSFDWFMRDYLSVKTGAIPRIDKVYDEFKNYASSTSNSLVDIVKDIFQFSNYYVNMILHKEPQELLLKGFKNISRLKVDVCYPFLLPVYNDYFNNELSKDDFSTIISLVENYVFRRAICGIPTNSMNKTFSTIYKSVDKSNYLESVKVAFQLMDGYKRFPTDSEFEKEIVVKDVYNFRSRNYLLNKLENHNRKEQVIVDEYTIEHILPQNPSLSNDWKDMLGSNWKQIQEQYLHTLGNLTLTGYNSELSDKPFNLKKSMNGGFDSSPIRLNEFLRKTSVWNEKQIQQRAKDLSMKASQIWFSPNVPNEVLSKYRPEEKKDTTYDIENYDYLKGDIMIVYQTLKKRILNIDSSVREEYKKLYIAYKSTTNFIDIIPQKARLILSLNIQLSDIIDPKGICSDVTGKGRWGNGKIEASLYNIGEIDYVMELIQQAFDKQMESI